MLVSLLVTDSSKRYRRAFELLARATERYRIAAEAETAAEALAHFTSLRPDLVILEARTEGGPGAIRSMLSLEPGARVLLTAGEDEEPHVMEGLVAGALDFTLRPFDAARLLALLDRIAIRPDEGLDDDEDEYL